ncbi:MAG: translation initiation factor [Elusimicrobia bacterium]|jgi:translation initiation factor 1|nr:translation initiation factor [Elusimicrobiota bacterium]MBK7546018.1 translation initiation factor [Elusimicrobiota bacterium]MBK7687455.1 translation initiation factor [Elusimicrobiota bacterium]MBK8423084.1 translation initiation factor [Elusimicrobiota bacterium]MBK8652044.1 translation initiation factor [Elusimicrobiota bacterium]
MEKPAHPPVVVRLERTGRGGKTVTCVEGVRAPPEGLAALLKTLKTRLGAGGVLEKGALVIQGDQRERLCALLPTLGYPAKRGN